MPEAFNSSTQLSICLSVYVLLHSQLNRLFSLSLSHPPWNRTRMESVCQCFIANALKQCRIRSTNNITDRLVFPFWIICTSFLCSLSLFRCSFIVQLTIPTMAHTKMIIPLGIQIIYLVICLEYVRLL